MKRIFILIPIAAVLLSACDALNTVPQSQVTPETYFSSESDLQLFSNSFYNNLLEKTPYDEQSDVLVCGTLSDEMYGGSYRTVPTSSSDCDYYSWSDLRKMNTLLEYIDQCDDEAAVVKYTALTHFWRAFFYFEKIKYIGDCPWYDTQLDSDSEELYKARDTREYVMTRMIEDIDDAIENVGEDENVYRVDKWAALCLKAQFCLFEGTFRKYHNISYPEHDYNYYLSLAADAAYEIMTTGPFKLYTTGDTTQDYLILFGEENANLDEWIFGVNFDYDLDIYHNGTSWTVTNGVRPGFTRKFVCSYLMADGTRFTDKTNWATMEFKEECEGRDPRMAQTMRTQGYTRINHPDYVYGPDFGCCTTGYHPIKFVQDPDDSGGQVDRSGRGTADMPVYRLGEVYLNYAEAKAELGTLTQSDLDISINLLRDRVGMPHLNMSDANANPDWYLASEDYGYPNVTGSNQGVILEIRRERTIELVMEGFRWWDLMRWKCGACVNQPIYGMYFPGEGEYDLTGDDEADTVFYIGNNPYATDVTNVNEINVDIYFTESDGGYVYNHKPIEGYRTAFNEERDYLYPLPINDRTLNPNLTQNPGWSDGLGY